MGFATLTGFRPDDPDSTGLFRFEPGHDVEAFDGLGGRVRVHFALTGPDAVSLVDADADDMPDSVEQVAAAYEEVLAFFARQRFREPVSDLDNPLGDGGNDRLDVYLIDFAGRPTAPSYATAARQRAPSAAATSFRKTTSRVMATRAFGSQAESSRATSSSM